MDEINLKVIKGYGSFAKVFDHGRKFYLGKALLAACFRPCREISGKSGIPNDEANIVHYGVSIRRKAARRAVMRNRIKRLLRESIRRNIGDFILDNGNCPFEYLIVIWNDIPEHPGLIKLEDVEPVVKTGLQKAFDYYLKKRTSQ